MVVPAAVGVVMIAEELLVHNPVPGAGLLPASIAEVTLQSV
jgi:hypothetical protein